MRPVLSSKMAILAGFLSFILDSNREKKPKFQSFSSRSGNRLILYITCRAAAKGSVEEFL